MSALEKITIEDLRPRIQRKLPGGRVEVRTRNVESRHGYGGLELHFNTTVMAAKEFETWEAERMAKPELREAVEKYNAQAEERTRAEKQRADRIAATRAAFIATMPNELQSILNYDGKLVIGDFIEVHFDVVVNDNEARLDVNINPSCSSIDVSKAAELYRLLHTTGSALLVKR
ncbi:MAG: hypothetical protein EPN91_08665 [Salinibacterium sp.]|nr:MAG: hypothetical protein EPN91_08665 [Salinibacterium sp.]